MTSIVRVMTLRTELEVNTWSNYTHSCQIYGEVRRRGRGGGGGRDQNKRESEIVK